jgi:hypothetical protein
MDLSSLPSDGVLGDFDPFATNPFIFFKPWIKKHRYETSGYADRSRIVGDVRQNNLERPKNPGLLIETSFAIHR